MQVEKPPYPFIYRKLVEGNVIPFLGAGVPLYSRDPKMTTWVQNGSVAYLPGGRELAAYLGAECSLAVSECDELAKMAQYYEALNGSTPLHKCLQGIFSCSQPPTPIHKFLAAIPKPLLVVTTNYDDAMERAYDSVGKPYNVVFHIPDQDKQDKVLLRPSGAHEPQETMRDKLPEDLMKIPVIYKIHGTIDRREGKTGSYVITEDDYIDFLTAMIHNTIVPEIFAQPFQERHFLFLGHGLYDWNLRVILKGIQKVQRGRNAEVRSWAIEALSKPVDRRLWNSRGVILYDNLTLEQFLTELQKQAKNPEAETSMAAKGA